MLGFGNQKPNWTRTNSNSYCLVCVVRFEPKHTNKTNERKKKILGQPQYYCYVNETFPRDGWMDGAVCACVRPCKADVCVCTVCMMCTKTVCVSLSPSAWKVEPNVCVSVVGSVCVNAGRRHRRMSEPCVFTVSPSYKHTHTHIWLECGCHSVPASLWECVAAALLCVRGARRNSFWYDVRQDSHAVQHYVCSSFTCQRHPINF